MVKLSREGVDFGFIVVIFDFVLLSQRLRHCFAQRSRLSVRFGFGSFYFSLHAV